MSLEILRFPVAESGSDVSALLRRPPGANTLLILGHGAGAGMRHPFMVGIAESLADHGVATLRYQYPYMERGGGWPDPRPTLLGTIRAAARLAADLEPDLRRLAGGKSMAGRMSSLAAAEEPLPGVAGLVFFGFPLHPAGKPATSRAEHLGRVRLPMLFIQGTRDRLARLDLLRPAVERLGSRARLHVIEDADHSFGVLKRAGRSREEVLDEMARVTAAWVGSLAGGGSNAP